MVEVIKDYLDIVMEEDGYDPNPEDMAEYILGCCETWGMLPPTIEFKMGEKTVRDNTWEPEDEQDIN